MSQPDSLKRLAWLISDPTQIEDIDQEEIPAILGVIESVKIRLEKRYMATTAPTVEVEAPKDPDRFLTAQEAAERLAVTPRWLYDHAYNLPFCRRLADRTLRFSERGLQRWLERRAS